jgi:quercetin dioxygenase-like cupin family protein
VNMITMGFKAIHNTEVKLEKMVGGAQGTAVRWLITKKDGAAHFAMRLFEMNPGGSSPHHSHDWEHEVFVLEGECLVVCEDEKRTVGPGYAIFIPPNAVHHFSNDSDRILKFLCMVPHHHKSTS